MIPFCRKHCFCPINQIEHCLAQNKHNGCKNLIYLPTEHPKTERKNNGYERKREKRQWRKDAGI